jgi:cathepsin K
MLRLYIFAGILLTGLPACRKDTDTLLVEKDETTVSSDALSDDGEVIFTDVQSLYRHLPAVFQKTKPISSSVRCLDAPPVGEQGEQGSCTCWAAVYGHLSYLLHVFDSLPYTSGEALRSPAFVYNQTHAEAGERDCSAGRSMRTVLAFLYQKGASSESLFPYNVPYCDEQPSSLAKENACQQGRIKGWCQIPASVFLIRQLLDSGPGMPVVIAFHLPDNFKKMTGKKPYSHTFAGQNTNGGHVALIIGYDATRQSFIVQNSWGTRWGDAGRYYLHYTAAETIVKEAYVMW